MRLLNTCPCGRTKRKDRPRCCTCKKHYRTCAVCKCELYEDEPTSRCQDCKGITDTLGKLHYGHGRTVRQLMDEPERCRRVEVYRERAERSEPLFVGVG